MQILNIFYTTNVLRNAIYINWKSYNIRNLINNMEFLKFFIFGIAGVSVIIWVALIALWHVYMFPRIFNRDNVSSTNANIISDDLETKPILGSLLNSENLPEITDRKKYSMKSLVIADFGRLNNLKLDPLYTSVSLGVVFATFTIITYGLHSGFPQA